ncbi:MAG: bifunctional methylenetetrahydrofolate dehydrogenase/methenyltetrahydrofolate cyclohydrolase FolD [Clostridia bacterium]|nr:bifunctional methylenetetrahydrofolate dehydrogenase/methenyltetrahydrofolate cyclohydrolase FolD [Clostridia bacterium]
MAAQIIDGKEVAKITYKQIKARTAALREQGIIPGLTVIIVGENPASQTYVASKEKRALKLGWNGQVIRLPENATQQELCEVIKTLNLDDSVDGILVQLPLPKHINELEVLKCIDPEKDVDGFHIVNSGKLFAGLESFVPCTPKGIMKLIDSTGVEIEGKNAVVIGRSLIVGKPAFLLLSARNATVTLCHSKTENLAEFTRSADIVVAAIGKPNFVTADMIKPGAVVIDVGINRLPDGQLCGDVDFESVKEVAGHLTPVPGGVGQMTIAMLMENTVISAEARLAGRDRKTDASVLDGTRHKA